MSFNMTALVYCYTYCMYLLFFCCLLYILYFWTKLTHDFVVPLISVGWYIDFDSLIYIDRILFIFIIDLLACRIVNIFIVYEHISTL